MSQDAIRVMQNLISPLRKLVGGGTMIGWRTKTKHIKREPVERAETIE
jgi:hypothetical protein